VQPEGVGQSFEIVESLHIGVEKEQEFHRTTTNDVSD